MRKQLLCLICGSSLLLGSVASASAETKKLRVLVNWYSVQTQNQAWNDLIQRFQAANPDIELDVIIGGNDDRLRAEIAAGTAPDVVHFNRPYTAQWAAAGFFEPIDAYLKGYINPSDAFLPGPLNEATFRGRIYAIPTDTDIRGLFWNVSHLNDAGLPGDQGPQTWDEFNQFAHKLTKFSGQGTPERVGLVPWVNNWYWWGWFWTFGGDYFDPQTFKPTLNHPKNVEAFEWEAEYAKRYGTANALSAGGFNWNGFAAGKISMLPAHNYAAPEMKRQAALAFEYWGGPVPHPPGGRNGTWSGGFAFVVPKGVKNPDGAARLLRYAADPETQVRFYKLAGSVPATREGIKRTGDLADPLQRIFLSQANESRWQHPFASLLYSAVFAAESEVVNLQKPAKQVLDEVQRQVLAEHADIWGIQ